MQQRVAIARALAYQPSGPADGRAVRVGRRADPRRPRGPRLQVWRDYDVTILFVTHDIDESVYLSERIVVLIGVADARAGGARRRRCRSRATRSRRRNCPSSRRCARTCGARSSGPRRSWRPDAPARRARGPARHRRRVRRVLGAARLRARARSRHGCRRARPGSQREGTQIHLMPTDAPAVARKGHLAVVAADYGRVVLALTAGRLHRPRGGARRLGRAALHGPRSRRAPDRGHDAPATVRYSPS